MEWQEPDNTASLHDYNFRRFPSGMGSNLQWYSDQRSLVSIRTNTSHQLLGASGSYTSSSDLCQGKIKHLDHLEDRQHYRSRLYQQDGGDNITYTIASNQRPLVMVHGKKYPITSTALTRSIEFHCRQGVEDLVRQIRMEAFPRLVSEYQSPAGAIINRFICKQTVSPVASLYQLETRPTSDSHRCFHSGLVHHPSKALCQPTMESSRQSPISDTQSKGARADPGGSSVEGTIMVSPVTSDAGQRTTSNPTSTEGNPASMPEQPSRHHTSISRVGCLRDRCQSSHLSEAATDLVLSSWRQKSSKSYNSSFNKWACWCEERDRNPISGPISDVANFLAELFQQGYQYSSINVYRSSISTTHERVEGYPIGQHPTVIRLMKGVFNKRPPLPKYTHTWDVSKVTSYISSLDDNANLPLKLLSFKLVVLLALTRPSRSSDLASLDLNCLKLLPDGIQFYPSQLAKQSRPSKSVATFIFPAFPSDKKLCPKVTLQSYMSRTESFRGTGPDRKSKLLLSYVKPHNPISSSSIARWIISMLDLAGINTKTFKAHSVRGASASAAASAGITTNQIMNAADWSSESVFQKFYYRPSGSNQVGVAVLSSESTDSLQTSR